MVVVIRAGLPPLSRLCLIAFAVTVSACAPASSGGPATGAEGGRGGSTPGSAGAGGGSPSGAGGSAPVDATGSGGGGAAGAGGTGAGTAGAGGSGTADGGTHDAGSGGGSGVVVFNPDRGIVTGVRGMGTPAATRVVHLMNTGTSAVQVTNLGISGANPALFQETATQPLPLSLMPGADVPITITLLTATAGLPAAPAQDSGASLLTASLDATTGSGAVHAALYGLVLTQAIWEPTLGEILVTLGYKINVGLAQNNANPNRGRTVQQLPGVEAGTDEIAAPLFVKAGSANVTLVPAARFSPMGPLPFGWYPSGAPATRNVVGTMDQVTDGQTSNKARMVGPPLATGSATSFDPGASVFGVWVYTDELSQKFDTGTATNGDYAYSQDAPNSPANVHRFKVYPLKDAAGVAIANSFLLAVEEASNGDYQDYVFVLGNARVAP